MRRPLRNPALHLFALLACAACRSTPPAKPVDLSPAIVRPEERADGCARLSAAGYRCAMIAVEEHDGALTWGKGGALDFEHDALVPLIEATAGTRDTFLLLVALSTDADRAYGALEAVLHRHREQLERYESGAVTPGPLRVVVAGAVPLSTMARQRTRYAFASGDEELLDSQYAATLAPLVRVRMPDVLQWTGKGPMPEDQRLRLQAYAARAHVQRRALALRGVPDDADVWEALLVAGVDHLELPEPGGSRDFARFLARRRIPLEEPAELPE